MKDSRDKEKVINQVSKENHGEEKDNVNVRFALAIEELCSDDFSFDDEISSPIINE